MSRKAKGCRRRSFAIILAVAMVFQMFCMEVPQVRAAASAVMIKNVWKQTYLYEENGQLKYTDKDAADASAKWELVEVGDGSVRIRNQETGNYLNIENQKEYVESSSIQDTWYSARWYIEDAGDGMSRIRNSWKGDRYLEVENQKGYVECASILDTWDSAKWVIESDGTAEEKPVSPIEGIIGTSILIGNGWNQKYLYEENGQLKYADKNTIGASGKWELVDAGDGSVKIKNQGTGNCLNIENQMKYVESSSVPDSWYSARWYVEDAGAGMIRIRNSWKEDRYLEVENQRGYVECAQILDTWDSAKWVIESAGTGQDNTGDQIGDTIGATLPYTRYESENATRGGNACLYEAFDFDVNKIAAEASNQQYVALPSNGAYVEWTVKEAAEGVTMRFTMPDSADGMGLNGSLDVYVNGVKDQTVSLSSYWAWQYFSGDEPNDTPGGAPRYRFDEVHFKLNRPLKAGDTIKIQKNNGDALEYGVDFIEIEKIPAAIQKPQNAYAVTEFGAVANDGKDDLAAFQACVKKANEDGKDVYIPAGKFDLGAIWQIDAQNITITGAGIWYTNIHFTSNQKQGGGISGTDNWENVEFCNVYISSMLRSRYNQQAAYKCFMGTYGKNTYIHDFWEEHFECGFWVGDYEAPITSTTGLVISDGRIRNNLADGVNFCQGTSNSTVQNCSVRNNGDDGLAVWPNNAMGASMGVNNTFRYNTIENNWRAGGIAIFGGDGHQIYNNYIKDGFKGSGIRLNTVFPGYHFENTKEIKFFNNVIVNCGTSNDCYGGERGAIDLEASGDGIRNIIFENNQIYNAQRNAIQFGYDGGFSGIKFNNTLVNTVGLDRVTTSKYTTQHSGKAIMTYTDNGSVTVNGLKLQNMKEKEPYLVQNGFWLDMKNVTVEIGDGSRRDTP